MRRPSTPEFDFQANYMPRRVINLEVERQTKQRTCTSCQQPFTIASAFQRTTRNVYCGNRLCQYFKLKQLVHLPWPEAKVKLVAYAKGQGIPMFKRPKKSRKIA